MNLCRIIACRSTQGSNRTFLGIRGLVRVQTATVRSARLLHGSPKRLSSTNSLRAPTKRSFFLSNVVYSSLGMGFACGGAYVAISPFAGEPKYTAAVVRLSKPDAEFTHPYESKPWWFRYMFIVYRTLRVSLTWLLVDFCRQLWF